MNNEITIREALKNDVPVLLQYEQEVVKAERPMDPTIRNNDVQYYDLDALIENPRATLMVACDGDKIVATGYALEKQARPYLDHETYAYLGFMYTHPDFRGKGVNGMVVESLREWSLSKGLTEIRLTVYDENMPAIKAYEKMGFKKHIIEMRIN